MATWTKWVWNSKRCTVKLLIVVVDLCPRKCEFSNVQSFSQCEICLAQRTRNSCMKPLWSFSLSPPPVTLEGTQILQCDTETMQAYQESSCLKFVQGACKRPAISWHSAAVVFQHLMPGWQSGLMASGLMMLIQGPFFYIFSYVFFIFV